MNKINAFISWFPKVFKGKSHSENLEEISKSICETLINCKMDNKSLSCEDIGFVLVSLMSNVKSEIKIKLDIEKSNLNARKELVNQSKEDIRKYTELIKSL
jgi:hypothetical protein